MKLINLVHLIPLSIAFTCIDADEDAKSNVTPSLFCIIKPPILPAPFRCSLPSYDVVLGSATFVSSLLLSRRLPKLKLKYHIYHAFLSSSSSHRVDWVFLTRSPSLSYSSHSLHFLLRSHTHTLSLTPSLHLVLSLSLSHVLVIRTL